MTKATLSQSCNERPLRDSFGTPGNAGLESPRTRPHDDANPHATGKSIPGASS